MEIGITAIGLVQPLQTLGNIVEKRLRLLFIPCSVAQQFGREKHQLDFYGVRSEGCPRTNNAYFGETLERTVLALHEVGIKISERLKKQLAHFTTASGRNLHDKRLSAAFTREKVDNELTVAIA